jgi:hypothetical protein
MQDYKIKQDEYKKSVEVLLELIERKRDLIFDNKDNQIYKQQLESLRSSIELIEEDMPYLNPNY